MNGPALCFRIPKENLLNMVSERDIVFSNSRTFFKKLFKLLPNAMNNRSVLIRQAWSLNYLDILLGLGEPF